jgi:hypothetical protein
VKRLADQSLYEILEVAPDAAPDQIQAAYERARSLYGPGSLVTYTLMEPDEAALLEARIEDARGTLLDPERRARYDEVLQQPRAEARAAAGGTAGGAQVPAAPPPVIPAVQATAPVREPAPPAPESPPSEPPRHEPAPDALPEARPAILLGAALEAAGPAVERPLERSPPPAPAPILLQRELPPAVAPPPPAPAEPQAAARDGAPVPGVVVPPPLPDAWTGEALRQVRESRGLSVQQIAERTKVTRHHIENIEGDRFSALPAQVYLRGFLLAIARELRLDGQKVARSYIERLGGAAPAPATKR